MKEAALYLPIGLGLVGALVARAFGFPSLNRRTSTVGLGYLLALTPLSAFVYLFSRLPALSDGEILYTSITWMPSLGLNASLYLDELSALFALLISGIGTLVLVYAGYYFRGDTSAWRFLAFLLLFMTAMLGVVLAGDLITLFLFWEGTSITSYLLIGYKYKDAAARRGAFKALIITGGGGVVMLVGFLMVGTVTESLDFNAVLTSGDLLRASPLYPAILGFVALGAFTKSAQSPFHIWLPEAMSAPTPASAYLHSATMVKAGIYLLARLNPALGGTELWFWLLTLVGMTTMLTGAYLGLKQNDLKALLAYSTISQLGVLVMLIGQDTDIAFKAVVIGVLAHALYKSALFLVVGIIDHETGTRDLRELGGLRKTMPASTVIAGLAALSMAGLPPLFGFLAKETLLATVTHPSVTPLETRLLALAAVAAGAFVLAQGLMLFLDAFILAPRGAGAPKGHEAPVGMWLAPAVPAVLSLAVGTLPETQELANFLGGAAGAAFGDTVKVSLAVWTGINVPLLLSVVAVTLGFGLFTIRRRVRRLQRILWPGWDLNRVYQGIFTGLDRAAATATRVQNGSLRRYLVVMLIAISGMAFGLGRLPLVWPAITLPALTFSDEFFLLRVFSLLLSVAAAAATIFLRRDFYAILAQGASGLAIATIMILQPAPDVALVQIVVDLLVVVVLVLALTRLPKEQRERASLFTYLQGRRSLIRDAVTSLAIGAVISAASLAALTNRPRQSNVTPFYEANAKELTGASDIVGAIVVDFRAFDTLVEITVFAMAGLGIYTLLRYATRRAGDRDAWEADAERPALLTQGIGGLRSSPFLRTVAAMILPISMVVGVTHLIYGHDQPGDGFTAGVIVSLAIGLWYVAFGYDEIRQRLRWINETKLIGIGLLLATGNGILTYFLGEGFMSPVNYGNLLGLTLPRGFYLSSALVFDTAISLVVVGGVLSMLDALGHPKDTDEECIERLQEIEAIERSEEWNC